MNNRPFIAAVQRCSLTPSTWWSSSNSERIKLFQYISLSVSAIMRWVEDFWMNSHDQLKEKIKQFLYYSLGLDWGNDVLGAAEF
jgi:hypothetical protein